MKDTFRLYGDSQVIGSGKFIVEDEVTDLEHAMKLKRRHEEDYPKYRFWIVRVKWKEVGEFLI